VAGTVSLGLGRRDGRRTTVTASPSTETPATTAMAVVIPGNSCPCCVPLEALEPMMAVTTARVSGRSCGPQPTRTPRPERATDVGRRRSGRRADDGQEHRHDQRFVAPQSEVGMDQGCSVDRACTHTTVRNP
jgi:hypothetical protein